MSGSSKRSSLGVVAHVEDAADEDASEGIESTRKYATAANDGPPKERPNTSRSRADKLSFSSSSDNTARSSENKAKETRPPRPDADRRERKGRDPEPSTQRRAAAPSRPRDASTTPRKPRPQATKPASASAVPLVQQQGYARGRVDDPSYYGVKMAAAPPSRPRAQTRPVTYYAGQTCSPGMMGPAWIPGHGPGPGPPQPFPAGSFPPLPMWSPVCPPRPPLGFVHPPPPSPVGPPPGYFDSNLGTSPHNRLRNRFESRPSSALGFHGPPAIEYPDDPPPSRVMRRPSRSTRNEDDAARMPPPPPKRPQSAVPPATAFRPPPLQQRPPSRQNQSRPPPANRQRPVQFEAYRRDDEDSLDDDDDDDDDDDNGASPLFNDLSPHAPHDQRRTLVTRQRGPSAVYDQHGYAVVPATRRGRRGSLYAAAPCGSGGASLGESKMSAAIKYQNEVSGGAQLPLTAEALRKATKRGGVPSSRSTRSSGSREDSEYRRSNTTGITRSSCGNEEITIKVPGNSVFRYGGAEIECPNEGGEITWSSRPGGSSRAGSDRASTVYQPLDDSRRIGDGRQSEEARRLDASPVRPERKALPHRPRAPSQADSQSRGYSGAAFQMAPTPAGDDGGHKPGHGVLDPHDINNAGFFVLFALIGLSFVVAGIWFFFWARNGGMHFKETDWEDYKSTVLRRKGPNGTLLSGATPSTQLGGGSVYKDVADEDRATTVVTDHETALSGITAGASDLAAREKRKQRQKQRQKKKASSSSSRRVEADGVVADEKAEKAAEKELRSYRHEKPARVGGLNRQADGVHWGGSSSRTETGTGTTRSSNKNDNSDIRGGGGGGIRKVYSTTTASSGTERVRSEARKLREESRSGGGSGRRDFSYQRGGATTTDSGLSESLLEGAASPGGGGGGGGGGSELGTKSYHHPMPELRERDRRRREREERRERRTAAAATAGAGGYRREG
ncbi:hypothetical protein CP532_2205 [Ophiocordyceps camponoti-leonardi (nom. inval.)]|nr:hypothetical protein CP532_2205 [Ophiocordyceps camponoti-leonardi (nom. inval.)]